jgi:hypothetical protein
MTRVTGGQFTKFVLHQKYSIKKGVALALLPCCSVPGAADSITAATALRPLAEDVCVGLLLEHADKQAGSIVPHAQNVQTLLLPTSNNNSNRGSSTSTSSSSSSGGGTSLPKKTVQHKQPASWRQGQHRVSWCPLAPQPPHKAVQSPDDAQLQQLVPVPSTKVLKVRLDWKKGDQQEQRLWEAAAAMYLYQQQVQGGADGWDGGPLWATLQHRVHLHAPAPRDAASLAASELNAMPGCLISQIK